MKRLVLFDIDGTLLTAGGAGARAVREAMLDVYGETGSIGGYNMGGRTDPQIVRELVSTFESDWAETDSGKKAAREAEEEKEKAKKKKKKKKG